MNEDDTEDDTDNDDTDYEEEDEYEEDEYKEEEDDESVQSTPDLSRPGVGKGVSMIKGWMIDMGKINPKRKLEKEANLVSYKCLVLCPCRVEF